MSRLSFRPRPLDINKKLPIVKSFKDFEDDDTPTSTRNSQLLRIAAEPDNVVINFVFTSENLLNSLLNSSQIEVYKNLSVLFCFRFIMFLVRNMLLKYLHQNLLLLIVMKEITREAFVNLLRIFVLEEVC